MSIEALAQMSHRYGADEEYVLAGGGNTSCKEKGVLHVKGSGTQLSTIEPAQFVAMDMAKLKAMLTKEYPKEDAARESAALVDMMDARLPGEESKRPSVEAILHALFPYRYVLHVHPPLVNGLSCAAKGEALCAELFGGEVVWVPLTRPGYVLAATCLKIFGESEQQTGVFPKVVIMQNHGIFVAADSVEEIDSLMAHTMDTLRGRLTRTPDLSAGEYDRAAACRIAPALRMLYSPDGGACAVFGTCRELLRITADEASMAVLAEPFTPDHIVYCKDTPLILGREEDPAGAFGRYREQKGYAPKIVVVPGLGFFALGNSRKEAEIAKLLFLDTIKVAVYTQSFGGELLLPREFTDFILNWEFENYRQKVALSGAAVRRLEGKIAIVTGSAQGFGRGIAESLAAQGAYVLIADLAA